MRECTDTTHRLARSRGRGQGAPCGRWPREEPRVKLLLVHNSYQQPGGEDQVFASELELLVSHGHQVVRYTAHNDAVRHLSKLTLAFRTSWSRTTYQQLRAV